MKFIRKFLFHRISFVVFAILIQLVGLIGIVLWFYDYFVFFYVGSLFISIIALLGIINNNSHPDFKIAWIIPILILPTFGGLFYVIFGRNKLSKTTKRKMESIEEKTREVLTSQSTIIEDKKEQDKAAANLSKYIQNYGYYPCYANTITEYFPIGEIKFKRLKEELKSGALYISRIFHH